LHEGKINTKETSNSTFYSDPKHTTTNPRKVEMIKVIINIP
jgi:hypothetical protein